MPLKAFKNLEKHKQAAAPRHKKRIEYGAAKRK